MIKLVSKISKVPKAIKLFFLGPLLFAQSSLAQNACELHMDSSLYKNSNLREFWQKNGYETKAVENLKGISKKNYAKLLTDNSFLLIEKNDQFSIEMSIYNGSFNRHWTALSYGFSKKTDQVDQEKIKCESIRKNLNFQKEKQKISLSAIRHFKNEKSSLNWGQTIIEMEKFDILGRNDKSIEYKGASDKYSEVLKEVKKWVPESPEHFFKAWGQVMKVVYDKNKQNIDYCAANTMLTQALTAKCTNCVGETSLFASLLVDAQFELPKGWVPGVQFFKNHVRAVLYNAEQKRTYDLTYGSYGRAKSGIAPLKYIWILALKNKNQYPLSELNRAKLKNTSIEYLYSDLLCPERTYDVDYIGPTQLFNFDNTLNCGTFSEGEAPKHADSQGRTARNEWDEDEPKPTEENGVNARGPKPKSQALLGFLGKLFNSEEDKVRHTPEDIAKIIDSHKIGLTQLAQNLIPVEKEFFLESIKNKAFSEDFYDYFSYKNWLEGVRPGASKVFTKNYIYKKTNKLDKFSIELPVYILTQSDKVAFEKGKDLSEKYQTQKVFVMNGFLRDDDFKSTSKGKIIYVSDNELRKKLIKSSSQERNRIVYTELLSAFNKNAELFNSVDFFDKNGMDSFEYLGSKKIKKALDYYVLSESQINHFLRLRLWLGRADHDFKYYREFIPYEDTVPTIVSLLKLRGEISKKPIQFLKSLSALSNEKIDYLSQVFNLIKKIKSAHIRVASEYISLVKIDHISVPDIERLIQVGFQDILDYVLRNLFLNNTYFFTVEPSEEELKKLSLRPYFPKNIMNLEIKNLKSQKSVELKLPNINLPRIKTDVCKNAKTQYVNTGLLSVDCSKSGSGNSDDSGYDSKVRKGSQGKEALDLDSQNKLGRDKQTQEGVLESLSHGYDDKGVKTDVPTDIKIKTYAKQENLLEVKKNSSLQEIEIETYVDHRIEVHLPLKAWEFLIFNNERVYDRILYAVGLHHAQRERMLPLIERMEERPRTVSPEFTGLKSLSISNTEIQELLAKNDFLNNSDNQKIYSVLGWGRDFNMVFNEETLLFLEMVLKRAKLISELSFDQGGRYIPPIFNSRDFLKAAYIELSESPKKGWRTFGNMKTYGEYISKYFQVQSDDFKLVYKENNAFDFPGGGGDAEEGVVKSHVVISSVYNIEGVPQFNIFATLDDDKSTDPEFLTELIFEYLK